MKANFEKGTKICSRCRKELPTSCFYKDKSKSDGLTVYCGECICNEHKQYYYRDIEYSREKRRNDCNKRSNTFQRKGTKRGNSGMLKRDYELTDGQLKRRNVARRYRKSKYENINAQGILIYYDGKLEDLDSKEYIRIMNMEYNRQRRCAINGYVGRTKPSEHFLFDFDLEQLLNDNVYISMRSKKKYITKWWKGEIRHWTVNDGIWRKDKKK